MAARQVQRACAALLAALAVSCAHTIPQPPREVIVQVPVCPAVTMPARPVLALCVDADTDAECAARVIVALVLLEGYTEQLENLLRVYAQQPTH